MCVPIYCHSIRFRFLQIQEKYERYFDKSRRFRLSDYFRLEMYFLNNLDEFNFVSVSNVKKFLGCYKSTFIKSIFR